jgi:hypothetical protein
MNKRHQSIKQGQYRMDSTLNYLKSLTEKLHYATAIKKSADVICCSS